MSGDPSPSAADAREVLRRAAPRDAAALARLAESTFRTAFAAANTPANMDAHCAACYGAAIQARELADPRLVTLVAEAAGELVAYAQLRRDAPHDGVTAERPLEIVRFYVDATRHGGGLAHRLMAAALAVAGEMAADVVWLGVWEENPRAIAFYRKHGFAVVGEHTFVVGDDPQRDLLMMRPALLRRGAAPAAADAATT